MIDPLIWKNLRSNEVAPLLFARPFGFSGCLENWPYWGSTIGIYSFWQVIDGLAFLQYIGKSIDLPRRLYTADMYHQQYRRGDRFKILVFPLRQLVAFLGEVEAQLISKYNPPRNTHYRTGRRHEYCTIGQPPEDVASDLEYQQEND